MNPYVDAIVPAVVVVSIVSIVFGFAAFKHYLKHKASLSEKQPTTDTEELELKVMNQERIIQALGKRVETLESIVVHEEYELNRKFKSL